MREKEPFQPPADSRGLHLRFGRFDPDLAVRPHQHAFGQLLYCTTGIMEISSGDRHFISPPQYAVWIPPHTPHLANFRQRVNYQSVYVAAPRCQALPGEPCVLAISALIKAVLAEFSSRQLTTLESPKELRLGQVLLDQLEDTQVLDSYLPGSRDPALNALLGELGRDPGSNQTLAQWAQALSVTERTLIRTFIRETGLTFGEWKRRARFLAAVEQLRNGLSVEAIGLSLGYSTSSAFIAMFRRECGSTPEQFRQETITLAHM